MQDRYVGDIGDFAKYGLLRAIRGGRRLGVAWYFRPDNGPAGDGRHTDYLGEPDAWRRLDPELFDALARLVPDHRSVPDVEQSGVLGDATFAREPLEASGAGRDAWFERVLGQLAGCDLVYADPDKGLVRDGDLRGSGEHISVGEANALAEGRTAVIYHHNTRRMGGHHTEIAHLKSHLPAGTVAWYWRRVSNRTFFVIHPNAEIRERLRNFANRWGNYGELLE